MLSWAHIGLAACRFIGALLVGSCGTRAVSCKTPIYFIIAGWHLCDCVTRVGWITCGRLYTTLVGLMAVLVTASGNYATHCVTLGGGTTYGGIYGTLRNSCWWASTCVYLLCPPRAAQNPLHIVSTSCPLSSYSLHIAHCTLYSPVMPSSRCSPLSTWIVITTQVKSRGFHQSYLLFYNS